MNALHGSESDLRYAIERVGDGTPAWLYVLLEHQSTPDQVAAGGAGSVAGIDNVWQIARIH